jgi:hypothetical protein
MRVVEIPKRETKKSKGYTSALGDELFEQLKSIDEAVAQLGFPAPRVVIEDIANWMNPVHHISLRVAQLYEQAGRDVRWMKVKQKEPDTVLEGAARKHHMVAAASQFLQEAFPTHLPTFDGLDRKHDVADVIAMARYMAAHPNIDYTSSPDQRARFAARGAYKRRRQS